MVNSPLSNRNSHTEIRLNLDKSIQFSTFCKNITHQFLNFEKLQKKNSIDIAKSNDPWTFECLYIFESQDTCYHETQLRPHSDPIDTSI